MGVNMKNKMNTVHKITILIIALGIIISATGLLYVSQGQPYDFVNQYGDIIKMHGNGLYANDSHFMAPLFRGTDFTMLFVGIPLLILALVLDIKKNTLKTRLFLVSIISMFTYYSTSIAFGVTYNILHLLYIALFASTFFGLILAIRSINEKQLAESIKETLPTKGINRFLVFSGVALIIAWLPDIITSLVSGKSLQLIEVYTTAITYILDMGIIAPVAIICLFELKKRTGMGYILLTMLLSICAIIGVMLPMQSIFQVLAGIEIPIPALITKVASFVILAAFAINFNVRLFKNFK